MDKLKTVFSIFLIGFLIYLYIEDLPQLTKKVEQYFLHNTSLIKSLYSPFSGSRNFSHGNKSKEKLTGNDENEENENIFNSQYSKNIDNKYERKAEEEIDKLLELK